MRQISHVNASSCRARSMSSSFLAFDFSFFAGGLDEDAGIDDAEGS